LPGLTVAGFVSGTIFQRIADHRAKAMVGIRM
jgi:hypothetical protein